jgi:hypothetical protein
VGVGVGVGPGVGPGYGKVADPTDESTNPVALTNAEKVWLLPSSGIEVDHDPTEKAPPSTCQEGVAPPG